MQQELWEKIKVICDRLSKVTYENLTKIIRLEATGSSTAAQKLDDSFQNDVDSWMGGGTCFSMTWHLYQVFRDLGLSPRLVMGHKRKERNIHCALILPDPDAIPLSFSSANYQPQSTEYLFDPGYLIFDPLPVPLPPPQGAGTAFFPLVPNCVRLDRPSVDSLALWTGGAGAPMKLRFEYPVEGVSVEEFKLHWNESFYREMMTYPVLNRLDREKGVQYYYQKGNLVTRDANGSHIEKIDESARVETLSRIFDLSPELISRALGILSK
ncbi:hypothetical protein [uncultured Fibrobacter sp.]|uniref:hypothetical protein n=1 Tax=uncultured Fibrobacter sp. TaxID=261512 RepID=UPI002612CAFF|nr:hypothetical protein [uncultured Fibrobacter sp.]